MPKESKDKNIKIEREEHKKLRKAYGFDPSYELPTKKYKEYLLKLQKRGDRKDAYEKV